MLADKPVLNDLKHTRRGCRVNRAKPVPQLQTDRGFADLRSACFCVRNEPNVDNVGVLKGLECHH